LLDGEPRPGALQLSSTILARLTEGSASLRRGLVRALRAEGATIPAIAEHLGVSHQRVSSLLRRRLEQTAPTAAAHAPRPG
jgi:transposase